MMIVKERIKKTDGSIRFRNYLKLQKLGKGNMWLSQEGLRSVMRLNAWKIKNTLHSKSSTRRTYKNPKQNKRSVAVYSDDLRDQPPQVSQT